MQNFRYGRNVVGVGTTRVRAGRSNPILAIRSERIHVTRNAAYKYERQQKGNPRGLAIKQHVFPVASIARFTNSDGRVTLFEGSRIARRTAAPGDLVFCARRAWDHKAESGYMKSIEDAFQVLAGKIIDGTLTAIGETEKPIVNQFFALWQMRARYRNLESQEIHANGMAGSRLTKDEEECLEANGYMFMREGGRMPARQINAMQLYLRIYRYADELSSATQWGIITPQYGEFIVPDVPIPQVIPLTPTLGLVSPSPNGTITTQNLAEINRLVWGGCQEYAFAHDFSKVPI